MLPKKRMKMAALDRGEPIIFENEDAYKSTLGYLNKH
jgi:hypothetical protein